MITLLEKSRGNILGFKAGEKITHEDYENLSHLEKMKWEYYLQKQIRRSNKPKIKDNG